MSALLIAEFELATGLVEKLSNPNFEPEAYKDERRARISAMLDEKIKGRRLLSQKSPRAGQVVDLMEALKRSLTAAKPRAKAASRATPAERLKVEPYKDKELIPTWLKTLLFLLAAGAASLTVAASALHACATGLSITSRIIELVVGPASIRSMLAS